MTESIHGGNGSNSVISQQLQNGIAGNKLQQFFSIVEQQTLGLQKNVFKKTTTEKVSRGLALFGIGLGMAELLTPRLVAKLSGAPKGNCALIRLFGLREIISGVMILGQGKRPATGIWSRVLGDAMDLGALFVSSIFPSTNKIGVSFATASVVGVTALDIITARQLSIEDGALTEDGAVRVEKTIFVNKSPDEVYQFWRDFEQLPTFMLHLEAVEVLSPTQSRWVAKAPDGGTVEWEAQITEDHPGELIAWRSVPGSSVPNSGRVKFLPATGQRGTFITVELEYTPPGGILGAEVAKLMREDPLFQLKDDLRRFKQVIETGEVVHSEGTPEGSGKFVQRAARPVETAQSV